MNKVVPGLLAFADEAPPDVPAEYNGYGYPEGIFVWEERHVQCRDHSPVGTASVYSQAERPDTTIRSRTSLADDTKCTAII